MAIKNVILKSVHGAEIIEADQVSLKDITLLSAGTNPVVYVENSRSVIVDGLTSKNNVDLLMRVSGERRYFQKRSIKLKFIKVEIFLHVHHFFYHIPQGGTIET